MKTDNANLRKSLGVLEKNGLVRRISKPTTDFLALEMASKLPEAPQGEDWIYEAKFDGYRIEAARAGADVTLWSRNRLDWSKKFAPVAEAIKKLDLKSAVFDGEVVVLGKNGVSDFSALQNALSDGLGGNFVYCIFDLLQLNGFDLRSAPLLARKKILEYLLHDQPKKSILRYSPHTQGDGEIRKREACSKLWEGIMAKDGSRPYVAGRGADWIKVKCRREEEFAIVGYTDPQGARKEFGSLLLAYYNPARKKFVYAGRVGTGFDESTLKKVKRVLSGSTDVGVNFANSLETAELRGAHFTQPQLVAQIAYAEWTADQRLRQASFLGLREDKKPKQVTREA